MTLLCNAPPLKVWVRREYLRDLRDSHGEVALGYVVSIKSLPGRVFWWEVFIPEYAAMFDKLPISALLMWDSDNPHDPMWPVPDLPLEELQFWNCFSYDITTIEKNLVHSMGWEIRTKTHGTIQGEYLFTIDSYFGDRDRTDLTFAEVPDEHKSFNVIALPNGQIALYPNNRCRIIDPSLSPETIKTPDFLVSTREFQVEYPQGKWGRLGESEDYFWETKTEKKKKEPYVDFDPFEGIVLQQDLKDVKKD